MLDCGPDYTWPAQKEDFEEWRWGGGGADFKGYILIQLSSQLQEFWGLVRLALR